MIPLPSSLWTAVIVGALAFSTGWGVNGWRLNGKIAAIERDAATALAAERVAALDEYTRRDKEIKAAGIALIENEAKLKAQLDSIRKERKNAPPLPADCKPDADRMRSLDRAIDAANSAIGRRAK